MVIRKCIIEKYDPEQLEAPFRFIKVGEGEVDDPQLNDGGVELAARLNEMCRAQDFKFRFYSTSQVPGFDFVIVVRGELEDKLGIY